MSGAYGTDRREWWAEQQARERQLREHLKALTAQLAAGDPQAWSQLVAVAAHCPQFDAVNQMAISVQCPTARWVMPAKEWSTHRRWPAKGSEALRVWELRTRGDDSSYRVLAPVFDVSQTAGAAEPSIPSPVTLHRGPSTATVTDHPAAQSVATAIAAAALGKEIPAVELGGDLLAGEVAPLLTQANDLANSVLASFHTNAQTAQRSAGPPPQRPILRTSTNNGRGAA